VSSDAIRYSINNKTANEARGSNTNANAGAGQGYIWGKKGKSNVQECSA